MRTININKNQIIVNKINTMKDFTYNLNESESKKRYVVSCFNLYTGKNPSLDFNMHIKIKKAIEKNIYDSIGLWFDERQKIYHVDANAHFSTLEIAKSTAKTFKQIAIYDALKNETIFI